MKIIAVGMNYALHNKELGHTHENKEPVIFLKPDSAILKDGKPFFIPDFSNEVHYETTIRQLSAPLSLWNKWAAMYRIWTSI